MVLFRWSSGTTGPWSVCMTTMNKMEDHDVIGWIFPNFLNCNFYCIIHIWWEIFLTSTGIPKIQMTFFVCLFLQGMRGSLGNWPTFWHFLGIVIIIIIIIYNNGKDIYYWDCLRKSKNYSSHNHVASIFLSGSLWMLWDR